MHSTLVAGAAVPIWDGALLAAATHASIGPAADEPRVRIGVLNDRGDVYREIFCGDVTEHGQLLECLALHGFAVQPGRHEVDMHWVAATPASSSWPERDRRTGMHRRTGSSATPLGNESGTLGQGSPAYGPAFSKSGLPRP